MKPGPSKYEGAKSSVLNNYSYNVNVFYKRKVECRRNFRVFSSELRHRAVRRRV